MNRVRKGILAVLVLMALVAPGIAHAKVVDEAGIFSAATIGQLDQRINGIKSAYGRDVLIVTVPSLNGQTIPQVANRYINGPIDNIGGVFIFVAKQEKRIDIAVGRNTVGAIPPPKKEQIRAGLISAFKSGSFDQGILGAVGTIEDDFRAAGVANAPAPAAPQAAPPMRQPEHRSSGGGIGIFTIILIGIGIWVVISIIRGLTRGAGGGGVAGPGYGGGGYGGGGYTPNYGPGGYGGGGGGFWSSLLGGVGGAMAGNWLYDKFSGHGSSYSDHSGGAYTPGGTSYSDSSTPDWTSGSAGTGWSSDGGSSWGSSDSSSGSWGGSSDSGFGDSGSSSWGGGGDSGFGGSIDSGGGWGDSGGGGSDWS